MLLDNGSQVDSSPCRYSPTDPASPHTSRRASVPRRGSASVLAIAILGCATAVEPRFARSADTGGSVQIAARVACHVGRKFTKADTRRGALSRTRNGCQVARGRRGARLRVQGRRTRIQREACVCRGAARLLVRDGRTSDQGRSVEPKVPHKEADWRRHQKRQRERAGRDAIPGRRGCRHAVCKAV